VRRALLEAEARRGMPKVVQSDRDRGVGRRAILARVVERPRQLVEGDRTGAAVDLPFAITGCTLISAPTSCRFAISPRPFHPPGKAKEKEGGAGCSHRRSRDRAAQDLGPAVHVVVSLNP
jgi:hypothetical protein